MLSYFLKRILLLFISFHEAARIKAAGFIDEWFVNKQVVVKLHDQLIATRGCLY